MLNKTFQKALGFLQHPANTYKKENKTDIVEAFKYMLVLFLVASVLSAVITAITSSLPLAAIGFASMYITGIMLSVIAGLWLHLWAYIFGAKRGLNQTLKTVFYGGTPTYLFGWIPFIPIIFWLWSLYLQWVGLQKLHGMPGNKAAFSILIAFIIPVVITAVLALVALSVLAPIMAEYGGYDPGFQIPH